MERLDSLRQRARASVSRCGGQELARAAGWTHLEMSTDARSGRAVDADAAAVMPANSAGKLAGSARRVLMCQARHAAPLARRCSRGAAGSSEWGFEYLSPLRQLNVDMKDIASCASRRERSAWPAAAGPRPRMLRSKRV